MSDTEEYSLFVGCIASNRYPAIERATEQETSWLVAAARNLSIAEEKGNNILTICNGCFSTLRDASIMLNDEELRKKVNGYLKEVDRRYEGTVEVRHILELIHSELMPQIVSEMIKPIKLRVAVHYGCHLIKPKQMRGIDNPETPHIFDELVEVLGATSVPYKNKNLCCGAGGGVRSGDLKLSLTYTRRKFEGMLDAGVDCVVNSCPFCHLQLDQGQAMLREQGMDVEIPVIHISQMIAMAMGLDAHLEENIVPSEKILKLLEL